MSTIPLIHVTLGFTALGFGLLTVLLAKGTRAHRLAGRSYAFSMLGLNGTALAIYRLFGGFGPFHIAALISLVTVVAGLVCVRFRWPRRQWIAAHAYWMSWSYVGLVAAAVSEATTRIPDSPFWGWVFLSTFATVGIGKFVIDRHVPKILHAMRAG